MRRRNVAYIRVAQESDMAVKLQKQVIDEYAKEHNFIIDYYYIDNGYTGKNFDRPQLRQLLRDIKSKKVTDRIVVKDCSRICRNCHNMGMILKKVSKRNVKLVSVNDGENALFDLSLAIYEMVRKEELHRRIRQQNVERYREDRLESGESIEIRKTIS